MLTRLHTEDRGGAQMLEFVLVLPIVLVLVGLALTLGWGFAARALVERAADVAARAVALPADPYAYGAGRYLDPDVASDHELIEQQADSAAAWVPLARGGNCATSAVCVTFPQGRGEGASFEVAVSYEFTNPFQWMLAIVGLSSLDSMTLSGHAQGVRD